MEQYKYTFTLYLSRPLTQTQAAKWAYHIDEYAPEFLSFWDDIEDLYHLEKDDYIDLNEKY